MAGETAVPAMENFCYLGSTLSWCEHWQRHQLTT